MSSNSQLIVDKHPQYGVFSQPFEHINFMDYDLRSPMGRKKSWLAKKMGFNQFHFVGVVSPRFVLGCAIVDLKWVCNSFVYVYDLESQTLFERSFLQPLGRNSEIVTTPDNGKDYFYSGKNRVEINSVLSDGTRHLLVELEGGERIDVTLTQPEDYEPLVVCTRTGAKGWTYTQKSTALKAEGEIHLAGKSFQLDSTTDLGNSDWSCGYLRRETNWNWGCLSGFSTAGQRVGINVACGVNETSITENCFWVDGKIYKLEGVTFDYDRSNLMNPWRLSTSNGALDLSFSAQGLRQEKINALLLASDFKQPFGFFDGQFNLEAYGETAGPVKIEKQIGYVEEHYAKW